jgi:hypothetical protein
MMKSWRRLLASLALAAVLIPTWPVWAQPSNAGAIRAEIERLRVFYTDQHPDIQRLKSQLAKIEALRKQKEESKKAQEPKAAPPAPDSGLPPRQIYKTE